MNDMVRGTQSGWLATLKKIGAIWQFSPNSPVHAELTSGKHSDLFVNMSMLISYPYFLEDACADLLSKGGLAAEYRDDLWFVGGERGAVTPAHECARQICARVAFAEKVDTQMQIRRFKLGRDDPAYIIEDVLTTGGTARKVLAAIERTEARVMSPILALVNRSGKTTVDLVPPIYPSIRQYPIVSLVEVQGREWNPHECPLCKGGSRALKPKEHWKQFFPG
ncbi:MAG: hypothetical protein AAB421_02355 [Patescibacteria group bacterium]